MGPVGMPEMFMIFILALLLFGPKKLPELGRMLGKGLSEFRRAKNELKSTFETHMRELEKETRLDSDTTSSSTPDYSSKSYSYPYDEYGESSNGYGTETYGSETHDESYKPYETATNEAAHTNSGAGQENGTDGAHSEPVNASPTPEATQVAGTVPRSNGTQPVEPVSVSTEEEHRG